MDVASRADLNVESLLQLAHGNASACTRCAPIRASAEIEADHRADQGDDGRENDRQDFFDVRDIELEPAGGGEETERAGAEAGEKTDEKEGDLTALFFALLLYCP